MQTTLNYPALNFHNLWSYTHTIMKLNLTIQIQTFVLQVWIIDSILTVHIIIIMIGAKS